MTRNIKWRLASLAVALGSGMATVVADGPDVIVSSLFNSPPFSHGSLDPSGTGNYISAFSISTTSCNIGNLKLDWYQSPGSNQHPAIHQSMYRLKDNRFEQIGMAWIKHGFYALNESTCGMTCMIPQPDPDPAGTHLHVGCSDPYTASLNGTRTRLGPTWEINAHTGGFPAAHSPANGTSAIAHRLQVHNYDLNPALNTGAVYFVQGHYVHPDDAFSGNGNNNASYARITIAQSGTDPNRYNALSLGPIQPMQSAIRAWKDNDDSVVETEAQVQDEGLFILSAKVTDLGTGCFHYEYALQNLNSDRSGASFTIPLPVGVTLDNIGFHDVDYHDGDGAGGQNWDGTDWPATVEVGKITWATTPYDDNPNANALRWSTLYNFRFDANIGPADTTVTLGLFKPGSPSEVTIQTTGPRLDGVGMTDCDLIDCNNNGFQDACDIECGGDECPPAPDCGTSLDCAINANGDGNAIPDECEINCDEDPEPDVCPNNCNGNAYPDACDIFSGFSNDCQPNGIPDECDTDCQPLGMPGHGIPDSCDISSGLSNDCQPNGIPDECDILSGSSNDCQPNAIPDECETIADCDGDGVDDCHDLCPCTTPINACVPPATVNCCFCNPGQSGICITYPRNSCLALPGGTPICSEPPLCSGTVCPDSPCRDGCLVGDFDRDGDLDLFDVGALQTCFSAAIGNPAYVAPSEECLLRFDFDDDGDVDEDDYVEFLATFTGP